MKHTAAKWLRVLCGMVVMLAFATGITSVSAATWPNGIYIATATPHYKHPVTGKIEDAGGDGSAVLGQSMTESATDRKALVEVDGQGNVYVTVRLKLMDNIQDPVFQVDGASVSAELMQENYTDNTADYRMNVRSENSVIRCEMYVVPMGRKVIFYITVANLQAGSADFITSVKVEQPSSAPAAASSAPAQAAAAPEAASAPSEAPVSSAVSPSAASSEAASAQSEAPASSAASEAAASSEAPASESPDGSSAMGLQEFDASGNRVEHDASAPAKNNGGNVAWAMLGGVAAVLVAGGCVWYFGFFRKKK